MKNDLISGTRRKRESCETSALAQSVAEGGLEDSPPPPRGEEDVQGLSHIGFDENCDRPPC